MPRFGQGVRSILLDPFLDELGQVCPSWPSYGRKDFLFPAVGANGVLQPGVPLSHDTVQKSLDAALAGADIPGKFSTHCFRHGGAQYHFMSAPLGEQWSLRCVRFWGRWAEGEQVCACAKLISDLDTGPLPSYLGTSLCAKLLTSFFSSLLFPTE